jgi:hypothetical protein
MGWCIEAGHEDRNANQQRGAAGKLAQHIAFPSWCDEP